MSEAVPSRTTRRDRVCDDAHGRVDLLAGDDDRWQQAQDRVAHGDEQHPRSRQRFFTAPAEAGLARSTPIMQPLPRTSVMSGWLLWSVRSRSAK